MQNSSGSIFLVQETHSTIERENQWKNEWGGRIYFSHGASNARGVGIFFKNNVNVNVLSEVQDQQGRFVILDTEINGIKISLANIYGPNSDDPDFFTDFIEKIESVENENKIIGGDFNLVMNVTDDKKGGNPKTHEKALGILKAWCEDGELIDIWRQQHPDTFQYTWKQSKPRVFCRLDFFLVSFGMVNRIQSSKIIPGFKSDHSFVKIKIVTSQHERGPGFWKFNCSLLKDKDYCNNVNRWIHETREEYNNNTCPKLVLEVAKMKVRGETIKYASAKKKNRENTIKILEKRIEALEREIEQNTENDLEKEKSLKDSKNELEMIIAEKTKGAMIRSRMRWVEEGEKSTKFFFNLEKRNYTNKTIAQLRKHDNSIITNQNEILEEQRFFYDKLFRSTYVNFENTSFFDVKTPKLSKKENEEMEKEITEDEIKKAIKNSPNNKSPGSDGFPIEFYKVFWNQIKDILVKAIQKCYEDKCLHKTARLGLITLLPKPNKDLLELKNWRPISLLNCDYKIIAKIMAYRIRTFLHKLIHPDQSGFMKGRYIGENIVRMLSLIDYTVDNDIPALLVAVDFEKAFDSVEWSMVERSLLHFNFPPYIINWIKILYTDIESKVMNSGWASDTFYPTRGCRQGCPVSPYLFILVSEILAQSIRENEEIKGITIDGKEHKISAYADDTTLSVLFEPRTLECILKTFSEFQEISGLKVNYNKTEVLRIGSLKNSNAKIYTTKQLKWSDNGSMCVLGVNICVDREALLHDNYTVCVEKIKDVIKIWNKRKLTLHGKNIIIKSLLFSKLIYKLTVLPYISNELRNELNHIIRDFLWDNGSSKIAHSVLIGDYEEGGLRMIDFTCKENSLKASWAVRLYKNNGPLVDLANMYLIPSMGKIMWKCNIAATDVNEIIHRDSFWKDVFYSWCLYNFKIPDTRAEIENQVIWYNSLLKIGRKMQVFPNAKNAGIMYIKDIINGDGTLLSYNEIVGRYGNCMTIMEYNSVKSCIPQDWKRILRDGRAGPKSSNIEKISKFPSPSKIIYDSLIESSKSAPISTQNKWNTILGTNIEEWKGIYKSIYLTTISTKLRDFQFRLLHRTIVTNKKLTQMKLSNNDKCTFCNNETETIEHLLFECQCCKIIWNRLVQWIKQTTHIELEVTLLNILFGIPLNDRFPLKQAINTCLTIARQYIYACRCLNRIPSFQVLIEKIKTMKLIEYKIAHKQDKLKKHNEKWKSLNF